MTPKKIAFGVFIFLGVALVVAFIYVLQLPSYEYGVDTAKYPQECGAYYESSPSHVRDPNIQFSSIIWSEGNCTGITNKNVSDKFYAYTGHIHKKSQFYSSIDVTFHEGKSDHVRYIEGSMKITITDGYGVIIPHERAEYYENSGRFIQEYKTNIPRAMTQKISFQLQSDGEIIDVEKTYPLKLYKHTTLLGWFTSQ